MIRDGIIQYHDALEPLLVSIDAVERHPRNYNQGDVEAIEESIEVNGMYRPVIAQKSTGYILAGNHTWETLAGQGAQRVPVIYLDVSDKEAYRIMITDNRTAALAIPNPVALVPLLMDIAAEYGSLAGTGYNPDDLQVLTHLADMPVEHNEYGTWPTLTFTVHPRVAKAFKHLTREADTDPERLELLLRLAGWDGH